MASIFDFYDHFHLPTKLGSYSPWNVQIYTESEMWGKYFELAIRKSSCSFIPLF